MPELKYATSGDWGPGDGELDPPDVDQNFWALARRIGQLEQNIGRAAVIDSMVLDSAEALTIILTDGRVFGPLAPPEPTEPPTASEPATEEASEPGTGDPWTELTEPTGAISTLRDIQPLALDGADLFVRCNMGPPDDFRFVYVAAFWRASGSGFVDAQMSEAGAPPQAIFSPLSEAVGESDFNIAIYGDFLESGEEVDVRLGFFPTNGGELIEGFVAIYTSNTFDAQYDSISYLSGDAPFDESLDIPAGGEAIGAVTVEQAGLGELDGFAIDATGQWPTNPDYAFAIGRHVGASQGHNVTLSATGQRHRLVVISYDTWD